MYVFLVLISVFILVSFFPIIELIFSSKKDYKIEYQFPQELFDSNLNFSFEHIDNKVINRIEMQNRGSVRIAQGRILSEKGLEEKKVKAFAVELP